MEVDAILDTIADAIAVCDAEGRVVRSNRALRDLGELAREDPLEGLRPRLLEALSTGGVVAWDESPPAQPSHGRTYAVTISPIAGAEPESRCTGAVVLLRDVTDERRLQRRLAVGDRMAAVGQLAAGLAHEINNPVSFAYSNLQMAKDLVTEQGDDLPPALAEMPEMLDECMVGIARVRDIVRDLRTFTSTEVRSAAGEVRLDDIIDQGLRLIRSEVQARARLVHDRDMVPLPPVRGDAGKLGQVLLNLVDQALHNLPPAEADGKLPKGQHSITVRTRVDRRRGVVELVVADTGPTLSEEMRAHLFEPFARRRFRLPPGVSAAMGMGLAVSYEVVRRHGGEIEARPGPQGNTGNEMIVLLPLLDGDGEAARQRARVLFIDDEPLLLRSYRRLIVDLHDITTASSAREALDLLHAGESFDAIFCDLVMPMMDGIRLYQTVAERDAACAARFVFLTGGSFSPRHMEFLEQVDNLHVEKPVDRESLLQTIDQLMGHLLRGGEAH